MEAQSDSQLIDSCRSVGAPRAAQDVPADRQVVWEQEVPRAAEPFRCSDGLVRIGRRSLIAVAA